MKSNDSYLIAFKKFDKILIHNREFFFHINNLNPISFTCPHNSPRQMKNKWRWEKSCGQTRICQSLPEKRNIYMKKYNLRFQKLWITGRLRYEEVNFRLSSCFKVVFGMRYQQFVLWSNPLCCTDFEGSSALESFKLLCYAVLLYSIYL